MPILLNLILPLVFFCLSALAAPEKAHWEAFQQGLPEGNCRARAGEMAELRLLIETPEFQEFGASSSKHRRSAELKLTRALEAWASDLLVKVSLQITQELSPACGGQIGDLLTRSLKLVRASYLMKLGFAPLMGAGDVLVDALFRTFVASQEEAIDIRARVQKLKLKRMPSVGIIRQKVFGQSQVFRGILILGAAQPKTEQLETFLNRVCAGQSPCPFWDEQILYKVLIVSSPGMAVYLPEVATLVLSQSLFDPFHELHQVVLLHELAHVAERRAWFTTRTDWMAEFLPFSGWKRSESGEWEAAVQLLDKSWSDLLTRQANTSAFTLVPDRVVVGREVGGVRLDGMVFQKGLDQAQRQNDPVEDFADSVAAFALFPQRFCFEGAAIATKKYSWVAKKIFGREATLTCPVP